MNFLRCLRSAVTLLALSSAVFPGALAAAPKKVSPIISIGADDHLIYDADERGNRVPDFSSCGYAGGDREIPEVPVRVVVSAGAADETARIQKALDYVASLPSDTNGIRGAVLLLKGRHEVAGELRLTHSGVVLRGQGAAAEGTVIVATGISRRTLLCVTGANDMTVEDHPAWRLTDTYVPVGATSFQVQDAGGLHPGDAIEVVRPSTKAWIEALGMTEFGGGLNDWRLVWHPGNYDLVWDRVIRKVDGHRVWVDAPLTTALETNFGGGLVKHYFWPGRVTQIGVENLRLESAFSPDNPKDENHSWFAITMENAADTWVRQVTCAHFAGSAVALYETCRRITVADCSSLAPVSEDGGGRRNTFFTMGQQTLFLRCRAENGRHDFAVGHCAAGPNAFVDCEADLPTADSGAIESWASGTLFDNVRVDGGGLSLINRGEAGEGAGWSAANSVLWNCVSGKTSCENPPGAQNWSFGSWGEFEGNGIWRNSNGNSKPDSLFAAQLADRLGSATAAEPAVIASSPSADAKNVDDLPDAPALAPRAKLTISTTNGWLICAGRLLAGDLQEVNWWKGNLLPNDVKNYGVDLTRFAPGRIGAGLTDDIGVVADGMAAAGQVALEHHYGLWYDRRREDHERVRRLTGDTWPPFYEQPFARSGQGRAWDGLSRYDLTRFNPWYWARLEEFATLADARGLVLFNDHYFQHNILEDGAHWVDGPWRSSNNINNTGFREPAFEIEKRTVMADQFYDVANPVRRRLHENFIRQNLDSFTNQANVIQFTSAEFTGPLAFEQFWLDTIGAWETQRKTHALIALAATKDVQDAILADPQRAAVVDIIAFRYWWQTDQGLFAPAGGDNLSPRQYQRQWKGGLPTDEDLAAMAADYRRRFPAKVVIPASEGGSNLRHASWAFVCAGGSLPNLPATVDPALLAAIPHMQPWLADAAHSLWALREPGKQILVYSHAGAPLDLSAEAGAFRVYRVDRETGEVTPGALVQAGGLVKLPEAPVLWLVKE
jgi:hypothetical protein